MKDTYVFLCECGGNISDPINLGLLGERLRKELGLRVYIHAFLCSPEGQAFLARRTRSAGQVLIGACSPHLHEETFKRILLQNGIQRFRMVALREEAAWTGGQVAEEKAFRLLRSGVAALHHFQATRTREYPLVPALAVIGGGIAGISAALKAAEEGLRVYLIEKRSFLGGRAVFLDRLYPRFECASCVVSPKLSALVHQDRIRILTQARLLQVSGLPGRYQVELEIRPRYVDEKSCNGCGRCLKACPLKPPAIDFHTPHPVPRVPVINPFTCLRFKGQTCRRCKAACPREAINFRDNFRQVKLEVGCFIVATGFRPYPVEKVAHYGYGRLPGVLTLFDLEKRLTLGEGLRAPGRKLPEKVAIVHCAGSRDRKHLPYCSEICCGLALKAALRLKELTGAEIYNFYLDLRLKSKEGEMFFDRAREAGINFIRGRVAEISDVPFEPTDRGRLVILAEDTLLGRKIKMAVDLVVLVPGFIPEFGSRELAAMLGICTDCYGFFEPRESKTSPVETERKGIWLAGAASGPRDITESVISAEAAALEASAFLKKAKRLIETDLVSWQRETCGRCYLCVEVCPYQALQPSPEGLRLSPELCTACGMCVSTCPSGSLELKPLGTQALKAGLEELLT